MSVKSFTVSSLQVGRSASHFRCEGTSDAYGTVRNTCCWRSRCTRATLLDMIEDREIWACANLVMRQYGSDAWFHAARRADELLAEGELEGQRTWLRILSRIEELEDIPPSGALH